MPATYSSPGVYVEEVPPMSRPIAGVSTSTPGFVGVIGSTIKLPYREVDALSWLTHKPRAAAGKAYRISSWANYVQLFGDFVGTEYAELATAAGVAAAAVAKTEGKSDAAITAAAAAAKAAMLAGDDAATAAAKGAAAAKTSSGAGATETTAGAATETKETTKLLGKTGTRTTGETTGGTTENAISAGQRNLAHAVFGFFNNGGTSCYVVRVVDEGNITAALTTLSAIEEISMVAAPGLVADASHASLVSYATGQQQFAILDFAESKTVTELTALTAQQLQASPYAAAYYPWLQVFDPAAHLQKIGDGMVMVPPSGHIAGVYARSDAARGAFKAPANEALLGVTALATNVSRDEQGVLNNKGINIIRQLNGALRVWGARTVGGDLNGEYRYVSTRRYFNYLRQSIDSGTQFVVFEPHTPALWQRVIRTLTDFLTNEWRSGALFGETAKQAFFIKCDAETNPAATRDQGQLIVEIGVAIVKPAEFVIFRVQQTSGS